jgi:hypothetical protein
MRTIIILSLIILVAINSCNQQEKSPIEGTWEMVSGMWTMPDSTIYEYPGNIKDLSQLYMFSKNYFMWCGRFMSDTVTRENYGGGTYQFDENKCEQTILYHPNLIGITVVFELVIKNDTLIITGPIGGDVNKFRTKLTEVYIRKD